MFVFLGGGKKCRSIKYIDVLTEIRIREMDNCRILYMLDAVEFSVCVQCDFT